MPSIARAQLSRPAAAGSSCTVQRRNGDFCDAPADDRMPFPICTRHAVELYRCMRGIIDDATATPSQKLGVAREMIGGEDADRLAREPHGVVYYLQVGSAIKIGTTENLTVRLRAYPPARSLLATETGGRILEQRRHEQFAAHRIAGNEWFSITGPLIEHVNHLRRAKRQRPIELTAATLSR